MSVTHGRANGLLGQYDAFVALHPPQALANSRSARIGAPLIWADAGEGGLERCAFCHPATGSRRQQHADSVVLFALRPREEKPRIGPRLDGCARRVRHLGTLLQSGRYVVGDLLFDLTLQFMQTAAFAGC